LSREEESRLVAEIEAAVRRLVQARERAAQDEQVLAETMLRCFQAGLAWQQIADSAAPAGISSAEAARLKAKGASEVAAPVLNSEPRGISVAEAAKRLGVQRATVYRRIDKGELRAVVDEAGRTRVILEE
jgi:excisionase family DNA binding protein